MALLIGLALFAAQAIGAHASEIEPTEELLAVAAEAGVEPMELMGAVNTTGLPPRTYMEAVGELAAPRPALSGRLACIAWAESRNDPGATNPRSKAAGLFQFLWSTWATTPQGRMGLSPYDPVAATEAAHWMVAQGRIREWVPVQLGMC